MPPPPGSRFGAEARIFAVGSTRATMTKMSTAGLIVSVTISGTCDVSFALFPREFQVLPAESNVLSPLGQYGQESFTEIRRRRVAVKKSTLVNADRYGEMWLDRDWPFWPRGWE